MGTFISTISRPLKNWNIENRAHKFISKNEPRPAPTYPSTIKQKELVDKLEPSYKELSQRKDEKLDDYLKKVYVKSNSADVTDIYSRSNPNRPLPKEKLLTEPFEYGFYQPDKARPGRITLRQALELLNNHTKEPEKYTVNVIANQYKLEPKVVESILEYNKIFQIVGYEIQHNTTAIAKPLRLSEKSGITVPHTIKKKKDNKESTDKKITKENVKAIESK